MHADLGELSPPIWAAHSTGSAAVLFYRREMSDKQVQKSRGMMCWVTAGAQRRFLQGLVPQLDQQLPFPSDGCTGQTLLPLAMVYLLSWLQRRRWLTERRGCRPWGSNRTAVRAEQGDAVGQLQPAGSERTSGCWMHLPAGKAGAYPEEPSCTLHPSQEHGRKASPDTEQTWALWLLFPMLSWLKVYPVSDWDNTAFPRGSVRWDIWSVSMSYEGGAWNCGMRSFYHRALATCAVQEERSYSQCSE